MNTTQNNFRQKGFSLIELMIGLVIGLIAALVITNTLSQYEKQKRGATGSSDAQTNGAIALYNIQRDIESAGWGLPTFGESLSPFLCALSNLPLPAVNTEINHDNVAGTPNIGLSPVVITNGTGINASDVISIRYGNTMKSGGTVKVLSDGANVLSVDNNLGCTVGDAAIVMRDVSPQFCQMTSVIALSAAAVLPVTITLDAITAPAAIETNDEVACLGAWNEHQYAIGAGAMLNQLTRTGALNPAVPPAVAIPNAAPVAIVPDIVSLQAQYGVTADLTDNIVTGYVNAAGNVWGPAITRNDRNRIKSIRVAVVARSGLRERVAVSTTCNGGVANLARVCIWNNTDVDLTGLADWANYRYRVYETIVPLRNVVWSRVAVNNGVVSGN